MTDHYKMKCKFQQNVHEKCKLIFMFIIAEYGEIWNGKKGGVFY
jgi:hypothetical protein